MHDNILVEMEGYAFHVRVGYEKYPPLCFHCQIVRYHILECKKTLHAKGTKRDIEKLKYVQADSVQWKNTNVKHNGNRSKKSFVDITLNEVNNVVNANNNSEYANKVIQYEINGNIAHNTEVSIQHANLENNVENFTYEDAPSSHNS